MKNYKTLLVVACLALAAPFAHALTYDLTSDHVTGGAGTPPFGTVTLTQNGTSVDFNVTLTAGYGFVLTGAADNQYFKFNAIGITTADITVTQNFTGFILSADFAAQPLGFNGDGTGQFEYGITSNNGNGGSPPIYTGPILFSVANSTIADFTAVNNLGIVFVADIIAPAVNGVRNTGPVDATTPRTVPDGGATVMLLGTALAGLGAVRRFLKK
jgi:hypothetical protein